MRKRKEDMVKRFRRGRPGVLVAGALVILLLLVGSVIGWRLFKAQTPADLAKQVRVIADIPLSGGVSRFDYQSLDQQRGLLFIAHLGASTVSVFDTRAGRVVTDIPAIAGVHGVLAIPELGRVYAVLSTYSLSLMSFHHNGNFSGYFSKEQGKIARKRGSLPHFGRKISSSYH